MLEAETSPPKHTGKFSLTKPGKYLNNFNDLKKYSCIRGKKPLNPKLQNQILLRTYGFLKNYSII